MRIAIPATGETLDSPLNTRFGRAGKFLVHDTETETLDVVDNSPNLQAAQGAGIQAAQAVAQAGANALITPHCGPRAFQVLTAAGVEVYTTQAPTVAAALEAFKSGALSRMTSADVEGHWTQ